jgi:hypothetical protein
MIKNWYKKSMPTIGHIKNFIQDMAKSIHKINGVSGIFVWGQYAQYIKQSDFILKTVDILASTDFFSEDLLSINEGQFSPFHMNREQLINEGYEPDAVNFTKEYIKLKKFNITHWVISNDKKLLHWGAIPHDMNEWQDIQNEAEDYAIFMTGITRPKLIKVNQKLKDHWSVLYDHHLNKILSNMPNGWYKANHNIDEIMKTAIKLI